MISLLLTTVVTSATDSINPIAIAQQFALQGMIKNNKHIWYFILAIGLTNFTGGVLAYFGLIEYVINGFQVLFSRYNTIILGIELLLAIGFIGFAIFKIVKQIKSDNLTTEVADIKTKNFAVTPISLIFLGIIATLSELATALPYFAFLAVMFTYQLPFLVVIGILIIYNIIYSVPLILMYILYIKAQDRFDAIYQKIQKLMHKFSAWITPVILGILSCVIFVHIFQSVFL